MLVWNINLWCLHNYCHLAFIESKVSLTSRSPIFYSQEYCDQVYLFCSKTGSSSITSFLLTDNIRYTSLKLYQMFYITTGFKKS